MKLLENSMAKDGCATPVEVSHRIVDSEISRSTAFSLNFKEDGEDYRSMVSWSATGVVTMALKSTTGGEEHWIRCQLEC